MKEKILIENSPPWQHNQNSYDFLSCSRWCKDIQWWYLVQLSIPHQHIVFGSLDFGLCVICQQVRTSIRILINLWASKNFKIIPKLLSCGLWSMKNIHKRVKHDIQNDKWKKKGKREKLTVFAQKGLSFLTKHKRKGTKMMGRKNESIFFFILNDSRVDDGAKKMTRKKETLNFVKM